MKQFIPSTWADMKRMVITISFVIAALFLVLGANSASAQSSDPVQSGSTGLTGSISAPPPTQGATISFPLDGSVITDIPITVTGLCPDGLLVKLFKNNVFAGSAQCINGNYSIQTDLFLGLNELIARVFDELDQPGPDSNIVTVTFRDNTTGAPSRVTLTSNFAKRGANPGENLTWPVILSGGTGPYAFSVNWGDNKEADLFTASFPGIVDLNHLYDSPGIYNIVIKAVDSNGVTAFLQLVGVANGPLSQVNQDGSTSDGGDSGAFLSTRTVIIWWPVSLLIPFIITTFWLGKRYMLKNIKKQIENGENPFASA
jgi:hypothetical protein